ncbi:MAG: hypothetical protein WB765_06900 [Acidimicrobiales bacterium]|jgi:hypothetical protein
MVAHVVELLTRYLGAHEVLVAARVELVDSLDSDQIEGMSSDIDARLHQSDSEITQVFVDSTTSEERARIEATQRDPSVRMRIVDPDPPEVCRRAWCQIGNV